jgi:tetratricopeptide (TPR) repeat protein
MGRKEEALVSYDAALNINPAAAFIWYDKGTVLMGLGRFEEADACFEGALKYDPLYLKAWYNKSLSEESLGKIDDAASSKKKFIELAGDDPVFKDKVAKAIEWINGNEKIGMIREGEID